MPPFKYEIKPNSADSHQVSPFWLAGFCRFRYVDSFTRQGLSESKKISNSIDADVMEETQTILTADNDVVQWAVSSTKESHLTSLSMQLINRNVNYVSDVSPGDWVCFWSFNDKAKYQEVLKKVKNRDRCNHFDDGIKFMGRVVDVRRKRTRSAAGLVSVTYSITASGFTELDSQIFYHPLLFKVYESNTIKAFSDFSGDDNSFIFTPKEGGEGREVGGLVSGQDTVTGLIHTCLGIGPSNTGKENLNTIDPEKYAGQLLSPNQAMRVPKTIIQWTTKEKVAAKQVWTYADIFKPYVGIQEFKGGSSSDEWSGFIPSKKAPLSSSFTSLPLLASGHSLWSLLSAFVNDPVEEAFACLRVDDEGYVMPSMFVRQTTLTSNVFFENFPDIKCTPFMSVPRWSIDESLISEIDFGRSDGLRYNWVRLHGQDQYSGNASLSANTTQDALILPKMDHKDIERSGLRWYNKPINANVNQVDITSGKANAWQAIVSDFLMGGHLRFQGQIICKGIVEPICVGDNLLVDDIVFHIEAVTHSGNIGQTGIKDFTTTIKLSNGVSIINDEDNRIDPIFGGEVIYPDLKGVDANAEYQLKLNDKRVNKTLHGADAQTVEEEDLDE